MNRDKREIPESFRASDSASTGYVDPDAPVRAGERTSPENRRASRGRADEGVRPYVFLSDAKIGALETDLRRQVALAGTVSIYVCQYLWSRRKKLSFQ